MGRAGRVPGRPRGPRGKRGLGRGAVHGHVPRRTSRGRGSRFETPRSLWTAFMSCGQAAERRGREAAAHGAEGAPGAKGSRWLWLWNPERLSPAQRQRLDELLDPSRIALATARAYQLKLSFQEFWNLPPALAQRHLERWCALAEQSGYAPMVTVAGTIRAHSAGILRWLQSRISNGMLQAMNSLVQAAKVRARGYRTTENFITMAYLVCGKLNVDLPSETARSRKKGVPDEWRSPVDPHRGSSCQHMPKPALHRVNLPRAPQQTGPKRHSHRPNSPLTTPPSDLAAREGSHSSRH